MEVLELAPPQVQTDLTGPGQATNPNAMPLADFIDEVMQILGEGTPSHGEILVERVQSLRWAEKNDTYEQLFAAFNAGGSVR